MRSSFLVAIMLILLSACSNLTGPRQEIVIGAPIPLTGIAAVYGQAQQEALEVAIAEINAAGGVAGQKLRVVYEDTQCEAIKATTAVNKLIAVDKVTALIGPDCSSEVKAVAPIVNRARVVTISPTAYADNLSDKGDYVFRITPLGRTEGETMGRFAAERGLRTAVTLVDRHEDALSMADAFGQLFTAGGGKILWREEVPIESADFRTQLVRVKQLAPEAVYLAMFPAHAGYALKQMAELGIKGQKLAGIFIEEGEEEVRAIAGQALEGVWYTFPQYAGWPELDKKIKARFGHEAGPSAAEAYDALMLLTKVMREEGFTPEKVKNALGAVKNYQGMSGTVSFNEYGDAEKPFGVKMVRNGKLVPYQD